MKKSLDTIHQSDTTERRLQAARPAHRRPFFSAIALTCGIGVISLGAVAPAAAIAPSNPAVVSTSAAAWAVVAAGENSANALTVQHLLNAAGFTVVADGVFGPATEAAVNQFQTARGLSADGIVGEQTWTALISTTQSGDSGEVVSALQVQLNKNGASVTVDGNFGPATEAAVQAFQTTNGLTVDGIVGPATWQSLVATGSGTTPEPGQPGETFATLSDEQLTNVRAIIAAGKAAGVPEYGLIVAVAAAMQESRLRNLEGGDRDSVGLFQQRPSAGWGDPTQLIDPTYASQAFFGGPNSPTDNTGLLDIPGWESMTVTEAAQAVQVSGYPDAYAQWETLARDAIESEG